MDLDVRSQVIALLEEGKSYRETADAFGLTYSQVYQQAIRTGIAYRRSQEKAARAEAEARSQREQNRLDRARLVGLLERDRRGELVPRQFVTHGHLVAKVQDVISRPAELKPGGRVMIESDEDLPLNRSEREAFDHLATLDFLLRSSWMDAPLDV